MVDGADHFGVLNRVHKDLNTHVAQNNGVSSKNQNYMKSFQGVIVWILMKTSVSLWALNMHFEIDMVFDQAAIGEI